MIFNLKLYLIKFQQFFCCIGDSFGGSWLVFDKNGLDVLKIKAVELFNSVSMKNYGFQRF